MRSHNICILRGISSLGNLKYSQHCRPSSMLSRSKEKMSLKLRLAFCNYNAYSILKSAYTSASFSLPSEYIYQSRPKYRPRPTLTNNGNQWSTTNKNLQPKTKIKVENINAKYCHQKGINGSLDTRSFYSCIKLDKNIVDILPKAFNTLGLSLQRHTYNNEVQRNMRNEITSSTIMKQYVGIQSSHVVYCSSLSTDSQPKGNELKGQRKPSEEKLTEIFLSLKEELPNLFVKPFNYKIYTTDIEFDNKITGSHSVGLFAYVRKVSLLRIIGHLKFAFIKFDILKITQHPENNTVRVRWRIVGSSALKSFPMVFKTRSFALKDTKQEMDDWYDGFSTFYVNEKGLIYKHLADKMIPDEEVGVLKKASLAAKLASLVGLAPKTPAPPLASSAVEDISKEKTGSNKAFAVSMLLGDNLEHIV